MYPPYAKTVESDSLFESGKAAESLLAAGVRGERAPARLLSKKTSNSIFAFRLLRKTEYSVYESTELLLWLLLMGERRKLAGVLSYHSFPSEK